MQISATDPASTSREQYSWLGWTGTGTGNYAGTDKSATITMNNPITETATWNQTIILPSTVIQLTPYSEPITAGNTFTVSGYITPAYQTTITLTFTSPSGQQSSKTVTSAQDGTFTYTDTLNDVGTWSITASWSGDNNYLGTTSSANQITVNKEVEQPDDTWDILQVVLGILGIVVSIVFVVVAFFSSRRKRGQLKNLLNEIDEAFFQFKRNSRRCEAELYRLKDIVLEQYKSGTINEGSYVILNERIDDYIAKLSQSEKR